MEESGGKRRQVSQSRLGIALWAVQTVKLDSTRLVVVALVLVVAVAFLSLTKRFCLTHSSGLEVGRPGSTRLG